jgi:hypothetical protein
MNRSEIAAIIRERALANGADPNVLLRMAQIESNLNPGAANPGSSAKGLLQFVDKTWSRYGNGADPRDPTANADAGARLLNDNGAALTRAGIQPTPANLYAAHFLGPAGATKMLTADPSAPVSSVLSPQAMTANPFLRNMSVSDLRGWAGRRMGPDSLDGAPSPRPPADIPQQQPAAPLGGMLSAMQAAPMTQPQPAPPQQQPQQSMAGQAPQQADTASNSGLLAQLISQVLRSPAGVGGQLDEARQRPLG